MDYQDNRISTQELQRELLNFRTTATLKSQLWTKDDLIADFKSYQEKDHTDAAEKAIDGAMSLLDFVLNQSAAAGNLFVKAQEFIVDAVKEGAVEASTEMILQPKKNFGLKTDQEFVTKTATTVVLSVIPAIVAGSFPPLLAAGFVFSIVIYLHRREAEKQAKKDEKLADELWSTWIQVREKTQQKQDAKKARKVEKLLMSSYPQDKQDSSNVGGGFTMRDCVVLLDKLGMVGPNVFDAALAFQVYKFGPSDISTLTKENKTTIKTFLKGRCTDRIQKQAQFEKDLVEDLKMQQDTPSDVGSISKIPQGEPKKVPSIVPVKVKEKAKSTSPTKQELSKKNDPALKKKEK